MDVYKYYKRKNLMIFSCWIVIAIVLTLSYIAEVLKGNRDLMYLIQFCIFVWIPLIISYGISLIIGRGDLRIKYAISASYLIFYAYVQITSASAATFVYIFPMLHALIVYDDVVLQDIVCCAALIINIIYVIFKMLVAGYDSPNAVTFYEIQIACLVLCTFFLHQTTKIVSYGNTKLIELNSEISKDELTGTYNRYFLTNMLKNIDFKINNISLAIIDVDSFKSINDMYGHKFGDLVLRKISSILIEHSELDDETYVIRIGGDEFIIISKVLSKNNMLKLAEKTCLDISNAKLAYGEKEVDFTVSIGVASSNEDNCKSYGKLYECADSRLYTVKHNGKNSVARA